MDAREWAVIRRFPPYADGEEHIVVDYYAIDKDDAERVLGIMVERNGHNTGPTRWRVASQPKVTWTDAP